MSRVVLDTSFLAHALIPRQVTVVARGAFVTSLRAREQLVLPEHVYVEFGSLLQKSVAHGRLDVNEALRLYEGLGRISPPTPSGQAVLFAAYNLATRLNQPDTFDTTGYALAQSLNAEFWVSDRRFYNAAQAAGLTRISLFD